MRRVQKARWMILRLRNKFVFRAGDDTQDDVEGGAMFYGLISFILAMPLAAFGHGEDRPGPHGGFIRMPGAFHTEVLVDGETALKVYLLDIEWKNPSVRDSKIIATFNGKTAKCGVVTDHFRCAFGTGSNLQAKGKLEIDATREKQKGAKVEYPTPLSHGSNGHSSHP